MTETKTTRPYLPELESVDCSERSNFGLAGVILIILAAAIAALTTFVYAVVKQALGLGFPGWQEWAPVGIGLFLVVAIGLSFTSWFDHKWKTDSEHLTGIGFRHRKQIPWPDISEMTLVQGTGSLAFCKVTVGKKKYTIGSTGPNSQVLIASIWQHLNRRGAASEDQLPPLAKSLWTPIPSSIPQEMDWHNPKCIDRQTAVSGVAVIGSLVILAVYAVYRLGYIEKLIEQGLHSVIAIAGGLLGAFYSRFQTAQSVSIRTDRFEARTLLGSVYVPWSEIKSAQLVKNNLVINAGGFRSTVLIPCDINSDDLVQLALSAIRQLRSSQKPLPVLITEPLASVKYLVKAIDSKPAVTDDFVEMRMPTSVRVLTGLAALAFIALALKLGVGTSDLMSIGFWAIPAVFILHFWYFSSRLLRVDSKGIVDRTMVRKRFISWSAVRSYSVQIHNDLPELPIIHLKDASGNTLITLRRGIGLTNHDKFDAFVAAMLADVPREEHTSKFKLHFGP